MIRRSLSLALFLAVLASGCQPGASNSSSESKLSAGLAAELSQLEKESEALQARWDKVVAEKGVPKITAPTLISEEKGRSQARAMAASLFQEANAYYDDAGALLERVEAWSKKAELHDAEMLKDVREANATARKEAKEAEHALEEWLDLVDELKMPLDPKTQTLQLKGMKKGLDYEEKSKEVNMHVARWAVADLDASVHREGLLKALAGEDAPASV